MADQHIQSVVTVLAIAIIDLPGPVIFLNDLLLLTQSDLLMVFRCLRAYQVIRAVNLGKIGLLEYDQVTPVVIVAKLKGWTTCKEPI